VPCFLVDAGALAKHIRHSLQERSQVTLRELLLMRPLEHGLAELVVYMQLAVDTFEAVFEEDINDVIVWSAGDERVKQASVPRIIFVR